MFSFVRESVCCWGQHLSLSFKKCFAPEPCTELLLDHPFYRVIFFWTGGGLCLLGLAGNRGTSLLTLQGLQLAAKRPGPRSPAAPERGGPQPLRSNIPCCRTRRGLGEGGKGEEFAALSPVQPRSGAQRASSLLRTAQLHRAGPGLFIWLSADFGDVFG